MKRTLSITACQTLVASALLVISFMVGALSVRALFSADERMRENYTRYTVPLVDLGGLLSELQHGRALLAAGLGGESTSVAEGYFQQIKPTQESIDKLWNSYKATVAGEVSQDQDVIGIDTALLASRKADEEVLALARAGAFEDATDKMRAESAKRFDALRGAVISTMHSKKLAAETVFAASVQSNEAARSIVILLIVLGLAAGVSLTLLAVRRLRRMLSESVQIAQTIAAGDLSQNIATDGSDETAQLRRALSHMQSSLANLVRLVKLNAENVAHGSSEIAAGNLDLSNRTELQASALQQTAATMEQLKTTVSRNASNSQRASVLASGASEVASRGGNMVEQVVVTMQGINDSSRQIADITSVIDGIAFQTNILALNAAVEAARAGEHGRGFAVVAAEVRTLAQRSAHAAKEIKTLISTSVDRVEQGTVLVDQAGQTMNDIVRSIRSVAEIVNEITSASAEQGGSVAQMGQTITQMDEATQQNASLVEQGAAAAESLKHQAQQLQGAVSAFRLLAH